MTAIGQIGAVLAMNLRSIPQRAGVSAVLVVGVACVVAVLVSVLAMSSGFLKTMVGSGRADRAIVLSSGAASEASSDISMGEAQIIMDDPNVRRDDANRAVASAELISLTLLTKKDGSEVTVPVRGVNATSLKTLRPEIKLLEGRIFGSGLYETIVGNGASSQYAGLGVGDTFKTHGVLWTIVGRFESSDAHDSELIADAQTMRTIMQRNGYQAVAVLLNSASAFRPFKDALTTNPAVAVDVYTEQDYYARQSEGVNGLLSVVAYLVGGIMAAGAVFGALNTMYSAVHGRSVEIATLRAIGFGPVAIVVSVLCEAMLLAVVGGVIGAFIAWLTFSGYAVSTAAGGDVNEARVFSLYIGPDQFIAGFMFAVVIGAIGGLLPAIRAARLPIARVLMS